MINVLYSFERGSELEYKTTSCDYESHITWVHTGLFSEKSGVNSLPLEPDFHY